MIAEGRQNTTDDAGLAAEQPGTGLASVCPVAVRGLSLGPSRVVRRAKPTQPPKLAQSLGDEVLVIDTETTSDLPQSLLVACYRHYLGDELVDEGLVVPDHLTGGRMSLLVDYARTHVVDLPAGWSRPGPGRRLRVLGLSEFLRRVFYPVAYRRLGTVVGYNLPFDLSRLASFWADDGDGGWFFCLLGGRRGKTSFRDYPGCPGLHLSPRGEEAWQIEFRSQSPQSSTWVPTGSDTRVRKPAVVYGPDGRQYRGRFEDLAQVMAAVSGVRLSLEAACARLGVPFVKAHVTYGRLDGPLLDYLREDVRATAELRQALEPVLAVHADANIPAHKLYSPASLARGYLVASGIKRAPNVEPKLAALGAAAFSGGRIEARIVRCPVPVVVADRRAAYVSDAAYLGVEELLAAEYLLGCEAREEFTRFLAAGDLHERAEERATCRWLARLLVQVHPQGEFFHTRVWFADRSAPSLTTAPFFFGGSWWVTAFDVLTASILSGHVPEVGRVVELVPGGRCERRPVRLADGQAVTGDLFEAMLDRQQELQGSALISQGFKPLRNSAAFGLLAQMSRVGDKPRAQEVYGPDGSRTVLVPPEVPGAHCCMPLAAAITAFGRYQLARIEAKAGISGGVVAVMDTDGACIVATPEAGSARCPGGELSLPDGNPAVVAMSFPELGALLEEESWACSQEGRVVWRTKFDSLRRQVHLYAICNKRLAIYRHGADGGVVLLDASEHLLGGRYLSPTGSEASGASGARLWVEEAWRHLIDPERHERPSWCPTPAVRHVTLGRPRTYRRFGAALGLRPFGFLIQAEPAPAGRGPGPVAPFSRDPESWTKWYDAETGERVEVFTEDELAAGRADGGRVVASLGGVIDRWWATTDDRYEAADAPEPGSPPTGLLRPKAIRSAAALCELVGKESTLWGQAFSGEVEPDDPDWLRSFGSLGDTWSEVVVPALRRIGVAEVAHFGKLHERKVRELLSLRARPRSSTRERLISGAYGHACSAFGKKSPVRTRRSLISERAQLATIAAWLEAGSLPGRTCEHEGCTEPVTGRRRFHSDACRKAAERARDRAALKAVGASRCRRCGTVRYGDTSEPCPRCEEGGGAAIRSAVCDVCGTVRAGDTDEPCLVCERKAKQ